MHRFAAYRIAAIALAHGLQAVAAQQFVKALGHAVAAGQAGAILALQQASLDRQFHARLGGENVERRAQRTGRHAECLPGRARPRLRKGRRGRHAQRTHGQARDERQLHGGGDAAQVQGGKVARCHAVCHTVNPFRWDDCLFSPYLPNEKAKPST
ncbi:hypothetical protein D3C72_1338250 [compost metagenome]